MGVKKTPRGEEGMRWRRHAYSWNSFAKISLLWICISRRDINQKQELYGVRLGRAETPGAPSAVYLPLFI